MQVALTRHCLMQLQMLDVPRRAAALRLLHGLGSNQLENQEALDAEALSSCYSRVIYVSPCRDKGRGGKTLQNSR